MKEKNLFYGLRIYMIFAVMMILSLSGCESSDPIDPPVPQVKPVVVIKPAGNIQLTSATMVALVTPNGDETEVSFEFKPASSDSWQVKTLSTYSGKDPIELTSDLSGLEIGTEYNFRVAASNTAGKTISGISTFSTYAVVDIDSNLYHTVKIGSQVWLKENLKVTHYANGDAIANVTDPTAWSNLTTGAYCWYQNDPKIGEVYGGLYNFYVGVDPRKLIAGWHVPTDREWNTLEQFLGGEDAAYPKMIETGLAHWKGTGVPATNSSGFTALPNGAFSIYPTEFGFIELGESANWWSSSLFGPGAVMTDINGNSYYMSDGKIFDQKFGFGIRLIKDAE